MRVANWGACMDSDSATARNARAAARLPRTESGQAFQYGTSAASLAAAFSCSLASWIRILFTVRAVSGSS